MTSPPFTSRFSEAKFFPELRFTGELRPSQKDVVQLARERISQGAKRLHIVAPPGSGKTILGLYLWAQVVKRPALVLSPNSAIQAQWTARTSLFDTLGGSFKGKLVSTDPLEPALLTSLTYQSVTLPSRATDDEEQAAREIWEEKLMERGQAHSPQEARMWLKDLEIRNPAFFQQRLATYRKQIRDALADGGEALMALHTSALATLHRLREHDVGLVILDECHHLLGYWGKVLSDATELFGGPIIVGLTATPPDREGKNSSDIIRYDELLGPIDYEVPVPAVVKDGYLAPYQDLVYFVRPTAEEFQFIATADQQLKEIVGELCERVETRVPQKTEIRSEGTAGDQPLLADLGPANLSSWLMWSLTHRQLPAARMKDWPSFERRDPDFAWSARWFLQDRGVRLPADVPPLLDYARGNERSPVEVLAPVLDRYVRHRLRRSPNPNDQRIAEDIISRLRALGIQITESGWQACASPAGRVMAYSKAKCDALVPILSTELGILGDKLRAVVVADYERSSATAGTAADLMDDEAGGAIAAFKRLVTHPRTDPLDPILVTGSTVYVDDDLAPKFLREAQAWIAAKNLEASLSLEPEGGFEVVQGSGADWTPRVYVELITELFQRGITRCLVGTRGLLGEGWDASKTNVLVDLTAVTTGMSVNQLRGRSIRLDPAEPLKLSNNWDVVCIASELSKGLEDYQRFCEKHESLYGVTDDGAIEKGVGHVHPAFMRIRPEGLEDSFSILNEEMLARAFRRPDVRSLWKIGQPYQGVPIRAVEFKPAFKNQRDDFPALAGKHFPWNEKSLTFAMGKAVLSALSEAKLIKLGGEIHLGDRVGGYLRLFLADAAEDDSETFATAMKELLGPLASPRYVIPRYVDHVRETFWSSLLPEILGRYLKRRLRRCAMLHAVPSVLAKNRELVAVFQKHWNRLVSPGQATFTQRGEADSLLAEAQRTGQLSTAFLHEKDVFL